jgi:phosphoglycolate phosphatase
MQAVPGATVRAVLFDLDGTFADTAPDMARALNAVRHQRGLAALPLSTLRPHVSNGARGMLEAGFNISLNDADFPNLRDAFHEEYARNLCIDSRWFGGVADLVDDLEQRGVAWGIVTNKAARFTLPLLDALGITPRTACVVCGDTCARAKPHPEPLLHAAELMKVNPAHCLYVGDDVRDIDAANAAGMRGIVALYGYLGFAAAPHDWPAAAWVDSPADITALIPASHFS